MIPTQLMEGIPSELRDGARCVLLLNSHAEGFATPTSDVDMMVVRSVAADGAQTERWTQVLHGSTRFDVHVLGDDDLQEKLRNIPRPLNMASLTFGHMIRSARPLVGADQWNELMLNFDVKSFDREATQLHFNRLHDIVEDVVGSFASDDMESAALGGQLLLASAIDGYLAAYGLTNPRPKWRICKLRAEPLLGDLVLQAYRQFEFGDMSAVLSGPARGLVQRLEFARFLQLATVMPSVCAGSLRDLCNSRNPKYAHPSYAMASMLGDDFVISNPGPRCRVGRFDLLVWLLWPYCDTSATIRRLMGEAASHYETTDRRFSGDVAGAIELSIAKLSKLSLFDIKA